MSLKHVLLLLLFVLLSCETTPPHESKDTTPADSYAHVQDENARRLIKKNIELSGGLERWNSIKQLRYHKYFRLLDANGEVEKTFDQQHEYDYTQGRIVITSIENGDTIITQKEGNNYQRTKNGEEVEIAESKLIKSLNTSLYVIGIPYKLLDPGAAIKYLGEVELPDGRQAEALEFSYDAEKNENHSTSDVWRYYFDPSSGQIIANWVDAGDHYSFLENLSFTDKEGFTLYRDRESYRVDSSGNKLYLRADYRYNDYQITF